MASKVGTFFKNIWIKIKTFFVNLWNKIKADVKKYLAIIIASTVALISIFILCIVSSKLIKDHKELNSCSENSKKAEEQLKSDVQLIGVQQQQIQILSTQLTTTTNQLDQSKKIIKMLVDYIQKKSLK